MFKDFLCKFLLWEVECVEYVELIDDKGIFVGLFVFIVCKLVLMLLFGCLVFGLGDVVVINDLIIG